MLGARSSTHPFTDSLPSAHHCVDARRMGASLLQVCRNTAYNKQCANSVPVRSTNGQRGQCSSVRSQLRAHVEQLRKELLLHRLLEKRDAARSARAALVADDTLDRLHVPEAPELEALF